MAGVRMYATRYCPFCVMARKLLSCKSVQWDEVRVDEEPDKRAEMTRLSGRYTVPQIWIGDRHIGGFDDLAALERRGELDAILKECCPNG